jgi:tetratricopeptide (TPR) repeat protein
MRFSVPLVAVIACFVVAGSMRGASAVADDAQSIRLDPKFADAYLGRSVVYGLKGEYERAVADANAAIQLHSNLATGYCLRGSAKQAKGDDADGDADIATARQLDPDV